MKKTIIALGTFAALSFVVMGSLALYIYNLDLGVDYKGRARLDYNWKYYFAACPKEEHGYEGKFFSFSYPSFTPENPLKEVIDSNGGLVFSGDQFLDIIWHLNEAGSIKSELAAHLSYSGTDLPAFSAEFMQWVLCESDKEYLDSNKVYNKYLEKINFRNGGSAILLSLWSKTEHRPHRKFIIGIAPNGYIFKVRNMVRYNATEATYRELGMPSHYRGGVYPDAARDAKSACVLNRVLETFEFKK